MQLEVFKYRIPFVKPFVTAHGQYRFRKGFVFRLQKNGISAWGEAAPLPSFSLESLDDVQSQIESLFPKISQFLQDDFSLDDVIEFCSKNKLFSSLQFGLFTATCFYLAQKNEQNVQEFLFGNALSSVKLNAVIDLKHQNFLERIESLVDDGFHTVKLKATSDEDFIEKLQNLRTVFPDLFIRLDANQSWSLSQSVKFLQKIEPLNIEYCEEPLHQPDIKSLIKLSKYTQIPIALDESLINTFSLKEVSEIASVLIIKPMILGITNMFSQLKKMTQNPDKKIIFTSSLEGSIGRLMTAVLATGLGSKNAAHGIATGNLLGKDAWSDEIFIKNASFLLPEKKKLTSLMQIDSKRLELKILHA